MRISTLFAFALAMSFALSTCTTASVSEPGADDHAIVAAVLREVVRDGQCGACLLERLSKGHSPWLSASGGSQAPVPGDVASSYEDRNRGGHEISATGLPPPFQLVDPSDVRRQFEDGPREGWERLRKVYGDRVALVRISMPGYSESRDRAVVTYSYDYGSLGGETNYAILARTKSGWTVLETHRLAGS